MTHNIEVDGGKSVKLPTAGKYCDRDIIVTSMGATSAELVAKYNEGYKAGRADAEDELLEYYNDKVTSLTPFSFYQSKYRKISLPALETTTGGSVFAKCANLERVELPMYKVTEGNGNFFNGCKKLKFVDFGYAERISTTAFKGGPDLETLILRSPTVVNIGHIDTFSGVGYMTVYVPENLIVGYQRETNWGALKTLDIVDFAKLEGSEYE